jgi:hypothetical protein
MHYRHVLMLRRSAVPLLIGLALVPPAHAAGPPTLPLDEVRAGMSCTARSVIRGTEVTTFDARVDDVISGGSNRSAARLLLTISGPAIDATGVGPGFSGSPVLCPGADGVPRIAGAISEAIGAYGGRTVLATPIQAILGEPVDPPRASVSGAQAASLRRGGRPLAGPLSYSGLATPVGEVFRRAAARAGRVVVSAPLRPAQAPGAAAPAIEPGSAIGVTLATGDVDAGAIGTAAYVDGTTVWGFGHPFEAAGRRSLFLTAAYVYGVVGNPVGTQDAITYKLAAPTTTIGTLTQDGVSAVVGRIGAPPPSFPLAVTVRDRDTTRLAGLRIRVADERPVGLPSGASALGTVALPATVQALYTTLSGSPVRQSSEACLRVRVRQQRKPLGFCNTYVGGGGSAEALAKGPLAADLLTATEILDAYDAGPLTITGVEVGVRVARGLRIAELRSVSGPVVARRGTAIAVRATLRRPGGAIVRRTIRVPVPRDMRAGVRDLFLKGTEADVLPGEEAAGDEATIDLSSLFEAPSGEPAGPDSLPALARAMGDLRRYDGVTARFLPPGASVPQQLPGGAEGRAQRARRVFRDPGLRISGRARLRLVVR